LSQVSLSEIRLLMKSANFREVLRAMDGIARLDDPALRRELFEELLHNRFAQIRQMTLERMAAFLGDQAVSPIQEALRSDPAPEIRSKAAELLGTLPDQGSTELLLGVFPESEGELQVAAAASLYKLGHPGEATQVLRRLEGELRSPDGAVRRDAVESLQKLGAPITLPLLMRAIHDTNGDVRSGAASALGELDLPEVLPILEQLLQDPYPDVRDSAKDAIEGYRDRHSK
jgi:HEAT repeat protein